MILKRLFINCSVNKLLVFPVVFIGACMSPREDYMYTFINKLDEPVSLCYQQDLSYCSEIASGARVDGAFTFNTRKDEIEGASFLSFIICGKRIYFNDLIKLVQPVRYDEEGVEIEIDKTLEDKVCSPDYRKKLDTHHS